MYKRICLIISVIISFFTWISFANAADQKKISEEIKDYGYCAYDKVLSHSHYNSEQFEIKFFVTRVPNDKKKKEYNYYFYTWAKDDTYSKIFTDGKFYLDGGQIIESRLKYSPYNMAIFTFGRKRSTRDNTSAYKVEMYKNLVEKGKCPKYLYYDASLVNGHLVGGYSYFINDHDDFIEVTKELVEKSNRLIFDVTPLSDNAKPDYNDPTAPTTPGYDDVSGGTDTPTDNYDVIKTRYADMFSGVSNIRAYNVNLGATDFDQADCTFKFCEQHGVLKTLSILHTLIVIVKIVVPILIIALGTIDYGKAVISGDENIISKTTSTVIRRLLIGVIIFFIPTIVNSLLHVLVKTTNSSFKLCEVCFTGDKDCESALRKAKWSEENGMCSKQDSTSKSSDNKDSNLDK